MDDVEYGVAGDVAGGVDCDVDDCAGYVGGYEYPSATATLRRPYPLTYLPQRRASVPLERDVGVGGAGGGDDVVGHGVVPGGGVAGLDGGV